MLPGAASVAASLMPNGWKLTRPVGRTNWSSQSLVLPDDTSHSETMQSTSSPSSGRSTGLTSCPSGWWSRGRSPLWWSGGGEEDVLPVGLDGRLRGGVVSHLGADE